MQRIIIQGFDEFGKRIADAVAADSCMSVAGIIETKPPRIALAEELGFVCLSPDSPLPEADAVIAASGMHAPAGPRIVTHPSSQLAAENPDTVKLPSADAIVLSRLLNALGGAAAWRRLDCTSAGCHAGAVRPGGSPDRLEPVFPGTPRNFARGVGFPSTRCALNRVHVPCSVSRIYYLLLEAYRAPDPESIVAALAAAPRCTLVSATDGFSNTASIAEYFRDGGRRRGEHHEVVVWEESLASRECHVYLMAEADPVAVLIPEVLDAIRAVVGDGDRADQGGGQPT